MALLTFFNGASSLLLLAIPSMMTSSSSESEAESIFQHEETFTNLTTSTNLTPFNNATLGVVNQAKVYYIVRKSAVEDVLFWSNLSIRQNDL